MDKLEALVKEACRALQRKNIIAAHARLYELLRAARLLTARGSDLPGLRPVLFGWLLKISEVARANSIDGAPVGADDAAELEAAASSTALIEAFERKLANILDRSKGPGRSGDSPIVEHIKRYLDDHYADGITIKDVAETMGWKSRRRVRQAWQEGGGDLEGPKKYLDRRRVDEAKLLVAKPSIQLKEIPAQLGFGSYRSFQRTFKAQVGMTPTEYRNVIMTKKQRSKRRQSE